MLLYLKIFFGRPLTKAFWKGRTIPNFHSVSDRCWGPFPILCSFNAVSFVCICSFRIPAVPQKVNHGKREKSREILLKKWRAHHFLSNISLLLQERGKSYIVVQPT